MKSKVTTNWFTQNWSQILVWVGTAGAVILFLLPWTRGGPAAYFFVFMAVKAMAQLPTRLSDGKAHLHQGAIRAGITLHTGKTLSEV